MIEQSIRERFKAKVPQEISEYYQRVVERREIKPGEIPLHFNGYLNLPLSGPISLTGFMDCPAGIALTESRVWVAHLPFNQDRGELWPQWQAMEKSPPYQVVAFGYNQQRLDRLIEALKIVTQSENIEHWTVTAQKSGLYALNITPVDGDILIDFIEEGKPDNKTEFTLIKAS